MFEQRYSTLGTFGRKMGPQMAGIGGGGWGGPEKVNILAPELFVLNFVIFWTSHKAFFSRGLPTLRGGNKGLTLKNNFLHV